MENTTREQRLDWLRTARGICSEDCDQPIFGWCDVCHSKLCGAHLVLHRDHTGHAVRSIYNERIEEVAL